MLDDLQRLAESEPDLDDAVTELEVEEEAEARKLAVREDEWWEAGEPVEPRFEDTIGSQPGPEPETEEWDLPTQRARSPYHAHLIKEIRKGERRAEAVEEAMGEAAKGCEENGLYNPGLITYFKDHFIYHANFLTQICRHPMRYASDRHLPGKVFEHELTKVFEIRLSSVLASVPKLNHCR